MKKFVKRAAAIMPFALTMMTSPVLASAPEASETVVAPVEQMRIPVILKNCTEHMENPALKTSLMEGKVEPYAEGHIVAFTVDQKLRVDLDGTLVTIDPHCAAVTDEDKEELRRIQKEELEERKRRDEALAKVNAAEGASDPVATLDELEEQDLELKVSQPAWNGSVLTPSAGVNMGPSGKETYYNLPMEGVISIMRSIGNTDEYWVREDGVKMLGDYVMVAAHLPTRPRGSLIMTSLGMGIVCDTGTFALNNHTQLDIAVAW